MESLHSKIMLDTIEFVKLARIADDSLKMYNRNIDGSKFHDENFDKLQQVAAKFSDKLSLHQNEVEVEMKVILSSILADNKQEGAKVVIQSHSSFDDGCGRQMRGKYKCLKCEKTFDKYCSLIIHKESCPLTNVVESLIQGPCKPIDILQKTADETVAIQNSLSVPFTTRKEASKTNVSKNLHLSACCETFADWYSLVKTTRTHPKSSKAVSRSGHHHHHHQLLQNSAASNLKSDSACSGDAMETSKDLENFANQFKKRRIKLGLTQESVCLSLSSLYGNLFSRMKLCNFESLKLSFKTLCKLKPLLQRWMNETELNSSTKSNNANNILAQGHKPKKRTLFNAAAKIKLERHFLQVANPSAADILRIAKEIRLEEKVVKVWFYNQRHKVKRLTLNMVKPNNQSLCEKSLGQCSDDQQQLVQNGIVLTRLPSERN